MVQQVRVDAVRAERGVTLRFVESVSGVLPPLAKLWLFLSTSETVKSTYVPRWGMSIDSLDRKIGLISKDRVPGFFCKG